jgi:DNA-binding beta-propeller fold protein YncE
VSDVAFDDATHTVFVIDAGDGTVSVFDGATCNGAVSSGCGQQAATTAVGIFPVAGLAFDPATRTLFVPEGQGRVFAVDTRHCRAGDATGCGRAWPALQAGAAPNWIANDPATSTLYVPNFFDADVSVLDGAGCNALRTTTCRHEAPSIALQEAIVIAVDPAVHTAYVTNGDFHKLAMFDTRTCSARHPGGCTPVLADMTGMSGPWGIALDPGTQTLYLGNFSDQDVVLLDPARCNYGHPAGCVPLAPRIPVGAGPVELSVNARTHMVYVGDTDAGAISAIDGTHCHVGDLSGCGAPVTTTPTGLGAPWNLFADASTNTIYVPGLGQPDADGVLDGHRVGVIDGAHCCAVKATVEVGIAPFDVGADPATHTLYVANSAIAEFGVNGPGTVSVVDTRHCEGTDVSGCGQTPSLVHTGLDPRDVFVDSPSHRVYIADNDNATMSVIDTRRCSAVHPAGCAQPPGRIAVGSFPRDAALDPDSGTLYVASNLFKAVSLVDTRQQAGR